jgi:hypothetical protein
MKNALLLVLFVFLLGACASVEVDAYRNEKPALDLARYFNGTVDGYGIFQDRSGKVIKRFHVKIDAKWNAGIGTLDEHFEYSDGSKQQRIWTITKNGDRYVGRAADVVGEAQGEVAGNALHWRYVLAVPVDDKVYNLDLDDWMYLVDGNVMLNRSAMSKFGIHLGDLTLSFTKR